MKKLRILPVVGATRMFHVFPQPDYKLRVAMEATEAQRVARDRLSALQRRIDDVAEFVEAISDIDIDLVVAIKEAAPDVDVVLVQLSSMLDPEIWSIDIPIIAWSGERTPMMGLYNLPVAVRRSYQHLHYCLDEAEVRAALVSVRAIQVREQLRNTRMVILGKYECADRLPDPEKLLEKLGVELVYVSAAEFLEKSWAFPSEEVLEVANHWVDGAQEVIEPDDEDIMSAARLRLALEKILKEKKAQAASVGCLEVMYQHNIRPFCWVLASLRDVGLPAGCEADAAATLTLLMVEYLAQRPGYMGNLVAAEPDGGTVSISHGCSPVQMMGRDAPAHEYKLVQSHSAPPFSQTLEGGSGLTSYVEYLCGQEVTIARLGGDLETLFVTGGRIVDCLDTICDRTTLTVAVSCPRSFVQNATGNHQCVFYGDLVAELTELGHQLGLEVLTCST